MLGCLVEPVRVDGDAARQGDLAACFAHRLDGTRQEGRADRAYDEAQQDAGNDDRGGIGEGPISRDFHEHRRARIEEVDAVEAEDREEGKRRHQREDAGKPTRGRRIGGELEGVDAVALPAEARREPIDDQREHVNRAELQRVLQDGGRERRAERGPEGDAGNAIAEHQAADQRGEHRNSGDIDHIVGIDAADARRLSLDLRPFGLGLKQDVLGALDQGGARFRCRNETHRVARYSQSRPARRDYSTGLLSVAIALDVLTGASPLSKASPARGRSPCGDTNGRRTRRGSRRPGDGTARQARASPPSATSEGAGGASNP